MLQKIVLVCLLAASAYGADKWEADMRVKFELSLFGIGTSHFVQMPRDMAQALQNNWQRRDRPASPEGLESLELWCPLTDYSFCVLFDDTGNIAGAQIGVHKDRVEDLVYDANITGFTSWTTSINGVTVEYYTMPFYFVSAEILKTSKEERQRNRDPKAMIQHGYVWMTGINGELYPLSTDTSSLGTSSSDFTTQACVPWMGQHYYHKMTKQTICSAENIFPWFPLMDSDQLIGLGFMCFMKYKVDSNVLDLFEHPDESAVKMIVNNGPDCLYDLARERGVLTMHVYFIDTPHYVGCPLFG